MKGFDCGEMVRRSGLNDSLEIMSVEEIVIIKGSVFVSRCQGIDLLINLYKQYRCERKRMKFLNLEPFFFD